MIRIPGDTEQQDPQPSALRTALAQDQRRRTVAPAAPPEPEPPGPQWPTAAADDAIAARQDPPTLWQRLAANEQRRTDAREQRLLDTFEMAVRVNPERRAEARRIAVELGTDPDHVERNIDVMREEARRRQVRDLRLAGINPALAARMSEIEFAELAHDDVEGLSLLEQIGQNWDAGRLEVVVSELDEKDMRGALSETDRERLASMRARLLAIGEAPGWITGLFRTGGQMVEIVPDAVAWGAASGVAAGAVAAAVSGPGAVVTAPGAVATFFTAGTTTRLFQRFAQVSMGSRFHALLQQGVDRDIARRIAFGSGIIEGALEVTGVGVLGRAAGLGALKSAIGKRVAEKVVEGVVRPTATRAAVNFAKRYAEGFGGEWATEQVQTALGIGATELGRTASGLSSRFSTEAGRAEIVEELADSAIQAAYGVGLLAGIGPTARFARDLQRARIAKDVQQDVGTFLDRAAESPMRERSPQAFESFLADATRGTAIETLHVDAQEFGAALRQAETTETELARSLPDLAADLSRALRDGSDVVIATSEYAAKLAGTPLDAALRPHLRTDALEMSKAEAEAFEQRQAQQQTAAKPVADVPASRDVPDGTDGTATEDDGATAEEEAREVEDDLREQLVATGRMSPVAARTAASLYRHFVQTQAERAGVKPSQFAAQFPLTVEAAPEAVGATPKQPGRVRRLLQRATDAIRGRETTPPAADTGAPLRQPGKGDGPRGEFDAERLRIRLFESRDLSTFLHELGHYFLEVLGRTASAKSAPAGIRADMETFLQWRGIESVEAWNAMSLEQQRPHHEAFAYSFEIYLFEGKAPSTELRGLFNRFKAWLRSVYRSIRDELSVLFRTETGEELPVLSPEVRQVMDRLVASEEAVLRSAAARRRAGIDVESQGAYDEMEAAAVEEAISEVERKVLGTMRGLEGARNRRLREMQAEAREVRQRVKAQVAAEVVQAPVYQAQRWLKSGRIDEGQELDTNHRLRRDAVAAMGIEGVPDHYLSNEGVPPDVVAESLGFPSGEAMVRALVAAPPLKDAIEQATDARMMAEHNELADPREMRRVVAEALANDVREQMIAQELRDVAKLTESKRELIAAAKVQAQQILDATPVGRVDPAHFIAQEERAANRADGAMRAGDAAALIAAKRDQLVKLELVKLAAKAQRQIDKTLRGFDRLWQDDEKVRKQRNLDIVNAARAILGAHNLASGRAQQRAAQWIDAVAAYDEETAAELLPVVQRALDGAREYRKLPHADFQALAAAIDELWFRARRSREIEVGGRRMAREEAVTELVEKLQPMVPKTLPGAHRAVTPWQRFKAGVLGKRAAAAQVLHFVRYLDGGADDGPFRRYLYRDVADAYDRYMAAKNVAVKRMHEIVRDVDFGGGAIDAPELRYTFRDRAELFGALLHTGNQGNLRRLIVGGRANSPWGESFDDGTFDASNWKRFFERATRPGGPITEQMMDAVQEVWDLNESIKPDLQKAHHALFGNYFEEVEATPIVAFGKKYRGGYVPAKVDVEQVPEAERLQMAEVPLGEQVRAAMPATPKGFMKSRTLLYARPLILDARLQLTHLDEVLRFLHVEPALRDARSILKDRVFRGTMDKVDPTFINRVMMPALERVARNRVASAGRWPWLDRVWNWSRTSSGIAFMSGNVRNALQQITGVANAAIYVPASHLGAASWTYLGSPFDTTRTITGKSTFMDLRLKDQLGQLEDSIEQTLKPNGFLAAREFTKRHAYFAQRFMQHHVDVVTWLGAYNDALARGLDEDAAVAHADDTVKLSQGSRTPLDVADFEAGTPFARIFLQFTGYANTLLNQALFAQPGLQRAKAITLAFLVANTIAAGITEAMRDDEWDDEDEDGPLWAWTKWFFAAQGKAAAASLAPGFSQFVITAVESEGSRVNVSPAVAVAQSIVRGMGALSDVYVTGEKGKLSERNVRDALTALSVLSGFPVVGVVRPVLDVVPSEPR